MYQIFNIKKLIAFVLATVIICSTFISAVMLSNKPEVFAADSQKVISLQIDNPNMTIDGQTSEIDSGFGTKPLIVDGHTLVPIRAIIESVGGSVEWNHDTKEVTLKYDNNVIRLVIDSTEAYLNDKTEKLDVAPAIINNRTMLPIRFISEGFGFNVAWDSDTKTIEITVNTTDNKEETEETTINTTNSQEETEETTAMDHRVNDQNAPVVYMTKDISPEGLMNVYNQLGFKPQGNVAVKLSTGEAGGHYYLDPNLIKNLVQKVNGTIVECNTAYGGSRIETAVHKQVAKDHGFTDIADVDIMGENGSIELPVSDKAVNLK